MTIPKQPKSASDERPPRTGPNYDAARDLELVADLYDLGIDFVASFLEMDLEDLSEAWDGVWSHTPDEDSLDYRRGYVDALQETYNKFMDEEDPIRPSHSCDDCRCHADYYMVLDEVWSAALAGGGEVHYLCIACLEDRIGRRLNRSDFIDVPINDPVRARTARHRLRLTTEP